jgi:hypothetical protein
MRNLAKNLKFEAIHVEIRRAWEIQRLLGRSAELRIRSSVLRDHSDELRKTAKEITFVAEAIQDRVRALCGEHS